jgi:hypothetical protein
MEETPRLKSGIAGAAGQYPPRQSVKDVRV